MKQIKDERIKFYLKHRQQIEEWAKIKESVHKFAHEFYANLFEHLRDEAQKSETFDHVDIKIVINGGSENPSIRFRRCNWPEAEGGPRLDLAWWKAKVDFLGRNVWCGIRVDQGTCYRPVLDKTRGECPEVYRRYDKWYPMYRYIDPPGKDFWEDSKLEEYGNSVIKTVLKAWCDLALLVDKAVAGPR